MLRIIAIKIFSLAMLIMGLSVIYRYTLYNKDLQEQYPEAIAIKETQEITDIYYFGESSNITYAPDDSLTNSIAEITSLFYPRLKITTINKYATHAGIYKEWVKKIEQGKDKPRAIIITTNLRSFDAAWIHSKLETPLQQSLVMGRPYPVLVNRFLLSLQAFDNKTEQQREKDMLAEWKNTQLHFNTPYKYKTVAEWDYAMAQGTYKKPDGSWDSEKITLACHYIKGYAFNIDENNPRTRDLDAIAHWCRENRVALYLNLMAENIEYADSLVGKELVFLMQQNRSFLVNRYHKNNCTVVDNLNTVPGRYFIDQNWTTEHYSVRGRMIIARNVADSLRKQFKNDYIKAY